MQYSFTLPADYDMAIIRRRIAEKGHTTDDFPGLVFKAYLHASRGDRDVPSDENLYAPFYLWDDNEGMNAFLDGPGFTALTQAFGRPSVRTWSVWQALKATDLSHAAYATRELLAMPGSNALHALREAEVEAVHADMGAGALAAISAFEPTGWTLARLRLWAESRADAAREGQQLYRVGHISQPDATRRPHPTDGE